MNFAISSQQLDGGASVIALSGEVDLYTAPELKQELLGVIEAGSTNVVVDLTETTFIDSTTLGVLVSGLKRVRPEGGQVGLVIVDRNIRKIFEITGLDRVFPIRETLQETLEDLEAGTA